MKKKLDFIHLMCDDKEKRSFKIIRQTPTNHIGTVRCVILLSSGSNLSCYLPVDISEIVLDYFINCAFSFHIVLFFRELFRSLCNSSQIRTSIITFFHIEQKPRSELFKWIIRIVKCCKPALPLHGCSLSFLL